MIKNMSDYEKFFELSKMIFSSFLHCDAGNFNLKLNSFSINIRYKNGRFSFYTNYQKKFCFEKSDLNSFLAYINHPTKPDHIFYINQNMRDKSYSYWFWKYENYVLVIFWKSTIWESWFIPCGELPFLIDFMENVVSETIVKWILYLTSKKNKEQYFLALKQFNIYEEMIDKIGTIFYYFVQNENRIEEILEIYEDYFNIIEKISLNKGFKL